MSKGKQWWPLGANPDEARQAIGAFQERLRERQWLKKNEGPVCFYVYSIDGTWPEEDLPSVNAYMQISAHDSAAKNQARSVIVRLLAMLNKWHMALRPNASMQTIPVVFTLPRIETRFYQYAVMVTLQPDPRKPGSLPLTLIVSEHDLNSYGKQGRRYVVVQGGDSYRWMTTKSWNDQRIKPSFGKWVYGSFSERKAWIEGAINTLSVDVGESQNQQQTLLKQKLLEMGLVAWRGNFDDGAPKHLGAYYSSRHKIWLLPDFWDGEAVREWLFDPQTKINFATKPNISYAQIKKQPQPVAMELREQHLAGEDPSQIDSQTD